MGLYKLVISHESFFNVTFNGLKHLYKEQALRKVKTTVYFVFIGQKEKHEGKGNQEKRAVLVSFSY